MSGATGRGGHGAALMCEGDTVIVECRSNPHGLNQPSVRTIPSRPRSLEYNDLTDDGKQRLRAAKEQRSAPLELDL